MTVRASTACDFYKTGHIFQYPEGTELVYSNYTPRSDRLAKVLASFWDGKVVNYGIQGVCKEFLIDLFNNTFFLVPKEEAVGYYKRRMDTSLGKGAVPVDHIAALWDLGYLPIEIKALPEGSRVNMNVPIFTIFNTLHKERPEFYWVVNYLETLISCETWKKLTTATIADQYRKLIDHYVAATGSAPEFAPWQGHDFSFRGVGGVYDASSSNSGHLLSFFGTDTIPAIDYLEDYYNANADEELIGGSVPATEHSVMCMGGNESEIETFRRLITKVYPSGIVSIVSDTWDFWKVMTEYASELKEEILARKPDALGNAKVVFRPDSGDPVEILCGIEVESLDKAADLENAKLWAKEILVDRERVNTAHGESGNVMVKGYFSYEGKVYLAEVWIDWNRYDKQYYYIDGSELKSFEEAQLTPAQKGAVQCLYEVFGGDKTEKGYITLNQRVGLIYGDSITLERAEAIFKRLMSKGFSAGNIVFGIGSYTYQYVTRDTFGQAIKATYGIVNGEGRELFKDPITDNGTKKSAKGLLRVEKEGNDFVLYDQQTWEQEGQGAMETIFRDGKMVKETSLAEIRALLRN